MKLGKRYRLPGTFVPDRERSSHLSKKDRTTFERDSGSEDLLLFHTKTYRFA